MNNLIRRNCVLPVLNKGLIKTGNINNAIAKHALHTRHIPEWINSKVIDYEPITIKRKIMESVKIKSNTYS